MLAQQPLDPLSVRCKRHIMIADKARDPFPAVTVEAEPVQNPLCHDSALFRMSEKMPNAVFRQRKAGRFSHVMEQRRPAQDGLRRGMLHHRYGMLPDISVMVRVALVETEHGHKLRDQDLQYIGKAA